MRGEKLASVGLLASGVAHELNNPLTGILTFSHLVRQKMPDKSADAEDMDLVIRETKRCAAIIKRLLDFAREKQPEKKFTDLNQVIDDTVRIVEQPAHLRDIEITLDLDRTLPPIWIDADQIKQVVMNMLVNAQHAVEEKGSITVSTRRAPDPRAPATEPKPMVAISIVDTGCGIPEANLQRIFDPFFTSKDVGKGTGLGLSVSHGIVEAHGGLIEVESKVGEGSTFRVFLPLTPPSAGPESKASGSVAMSARILIVDDEEIVIRSCLRILDGDEFQVEAVQDGREALRKIEENPYDVMILDIMMPNMDGLEVLRRVKETHPNVDVIMITGLSQIDTAVQAMKLGAFDYISKPFEPDELKLVVQRALERRRLLQENLNLKSEVWSKYRFENIIGSSPQMQAVYPADRAMRADQFDRPDHRRKRHRQGTDRARDPLQQPAQGQAVRRGRLQCVERKPAGKRAVRSRQGRFHRRGREQERHVRGRRQRHAVSRRDRQYLHVDPGQAAARPAGAGIQGGRRHPDADRQFPAGHRHQQGPQGHGGRRHFPRRPLLPDQYFPDPRPGAARAQGRHSGARLPFPQSVQRGAGKKDHRHFRRRASHAASITAGRAMCANSKTSCTGRRS